MTTVFQQLHHLSAEVQTLFAPQLKFHQALTSLLKAYAPEKPFKGTEYVGALGEVYAKLIFGGTLSDESHEHDLIDRNGRRVSVKTRRGNPRGWAKTSAIPAITATDGPEALVFVSLNDDFTPRKIWRFEWSKLIAQGRFKSHVVRGQHRSYVFFVSEKGDEDCVAYDCHLDGSIDLDRISEPSYRAGDDEPRHWSENSTITSAMERFGQASLSGTLPKMTFDFAAVQDFLDGHRTPAYEIMDALYSVRRDEGLDGYRGATRVLKAFLQLLAEHKAE